MRLLIIKLSSLGDVVHALPTLAALRRRFNDAHIAWLVGPAAAGIVAGHPMLDQTFIWRSGSAPIAPRTEGLAHTRGLIRRLRAERFDITLDLQGLFRTAILAFASGAPRRVGFRNFQEGAFLFNNERAIPDRKDVHAVHGYLAFAAHLGAATEPIEFVFPESPGAEQRLDELLVPAAGKSVVALISDAGWPSKRWPAERFAAVADALAGDGAACVIIGGADSQPLAEEISGRARSRPINAAGRTVLADLPALFRRCAAAVANDSGPMHIAAAVGCPVVALFGPTSPARTGPFGDGHVVIEAPLPCLGCRRRECSHLHCMTEINTPQVIAAAHGLLGARVRDSSLPPPPSLLRQGYEGPTGLRRTSRSE